MPPLPETIPYEQSEKKSQGSEIWVNIGIAIEPSVSFRKLELNLFNAELYDYRVQLHRVRKTNLLQTII